MPSCWATSDLVSLYEALWTPGRQWLCSKSAHMLATFDLFPCLKRGGGGGGGEMVGLYIHTAHLWASCDLVSCSQALGTP